jgi:hypothetical protein
MRLVGERSRNIGRGGQLGEHRYSNMRFYARIGEYQAALRNYIGENCEQVVYKSAPNITKRYQDALAKHEHITEGAYDTLQRVSATARKIVEAKLSKQPPLKNDLSKSLPPLEMVNFDIPTSENSGSHRSFMEWPVFQPGIL